jgi:hypothetical protein
LIYQRSKRKSFSRWPVLTQKSAVFVWNVIASENVLHIAQEHPADKWRFENEHHKVRLQTLRDMAKAHFEDGGYRVGENGSKVLIIGEAFARIRIWKVDLREIIATIRISGLPQPRQPRPATGWQAPKDV